MRWIEVLLEVCPEDVEIAVDLLRDYGYQGVAVEREPFEVEPWEDDIPPASRLTLRAYLLDNWQADGLKKQIETALGDQEAKYAAPQYRAFDDDAYQLEWLIERFSTSVGKRTFICPTWIVKPEQPGEVVIALDSSVAFGTGAHATTRMILEAAEDMTDRLANATVLDLGCGSGILGIAAAKLGAASVLGLDIDPDSVRITGENAIINGVADKVTAQLGSLDSLLSPPQQFDVVLANIIGPVIMEMCRTDFHALLRPDSIALISGIRDYELERVQKAMQSTGLRAYDQRVIDGWVALWVRREAQPDGATAPI